MGRSWPGRRTRRTHVPALSAADRRRADRDAADLAQGVDDVTEVLARPALPDRAPDPGDADLDDPRRT